MPPFSSFDDEMPINPPRAFVAFNDELLIDILSKRGYISDEEGLKKFIYVPKGNRKKGIIYIEDYECSNFSKQR